MQGRVTSSGTEGGPAQTRPLEAQASTDADSRPTAAEVHIHKVARNATAQAKAKPFATEPAATKAEGQAKEAEAEAEVAGGG